MGSRRAVRRDEVDLETMPTRKGSVVAPRPQMANRGPRMRVGSPSPMAHETVAGKKGPRQSPAAPENTSTSAVELLSSKAASDSMHKPMETVTERRSAMRCRNSAPAARPAVMPAQNAAGASGFDVA